MDVTTRLRRRIHYHIWANRVVGGALVEDAPDEADPARVPEPAIRWFAHLVACDDLWLSRMAQIPFGWEVWPEDPLPVVLERLDATVARWHPLLAALNTDMLDRSVPYVNTPGQRFENRVADILEHVVIHGSHHRGQIAASLRASGRVPPTIDFIHAVRQGLIP